MSTALRMACTAMIVAVAATSARAHHSAAAAYDPSRTVVITGSVVDFKLANPHSAVVLDLTSANGEVERWEAEAGPASALRRGGFSTDTFKPGDILTVEGWPHRSGKPLLSVREFKTAAGAPGRATPVPLTEAYPADPLARGISGRWLPPWRGEASEREPRPQGRPGLLVTQAGFEAWQSYEPASSPIVTCEPMNVPTLFLVGYVADIEVDQRKGVLRYSLYDVVRTVPLGGPQEQADDAGWFGMISGRMEGDELIVESYGYSPSKWGLAVAVTPHGNGGDIASSAQKKVVERYSVSEDGQTLFLDYTLQDEVYLREPFSERLAWTRLSDDAPLEEFNCDPESASRFTGSAR